MSLLEPTIPLYRDDDHCFETAAQVVAVRGSEIAFDRTCCYPGGGGQPCDTGVVHISGEEPLSIVSVQAGSDEIVWHDVGSTVDPRVTGRTAKLGLDTARRLAFMRYHTVLHILNTIALRDYGGWITGVQISTDYSRIDFNLEGFSPAMRAELEGKVNAVIAAGHALKSYYIPEDEFQRRKDLLRTLDVKPPVRRGQVRVVEIEGFDAQACGGTHMHTTAEAGAFSIYKTENKGRINKRLYIKLT